MNHRSLAAIRARLESAVALLPDPPENPEDLWDRYESVAIAMLDSEHAEYRPGELEEYLQTFLYLHSLELGLVAFPRTHDQL